MSGTDARRLIAPDRRPRVPSDTTLLAPFLRWHRQNYVLKGCNGSIEGEEQTRLRPFSESPLRQLRVRDRKAKVENNMTDVPAEPAEEYIRRAMSEDRVLGEWTGEVWDRRAYFVASERGVTRGLGALGP